MTATDTQSRVTGNNLKRQWEATLNRKNSIKRWVATNGQSGLIVSILIVGIILIKYDVTFTQLILIALVSWKLRSFVSNDRIKEVLPDGDKIISAFTAIILVSAVLTSGFMDWTVNKVDSMELAASCAANSSRPKCIKLEKEENKKQGAREYSRTRTTLLSTPANSPTTLSAPACGISWAKVDIPPGWNVTLSWNEMAADYRWRNVRTGQWQADVPSQGADAVRFCAKHKNYIGDRMKISWSRI
jgi:hypothetical protein